MAPAPAPLFISWRFALLAAFWNYLTLFRFKTIAYIITSFLCNTLYLYYLAYCISHLRQIYAFGVNQDEDCKWLHSGNGAVVGVPRCALKASARRRLSPPSGKPRPGQHKKRPSCENTQSVLCQTGVPPENTIVSFLINLCYLHQAAILA